MTRNELESFVRLLTENKFTPNDLGLLPPGFLTKADDYFQSTDFFTDTYGRKVWDALNNDTRFWNMIRKVPFGSTTGWRIRGSRPDGDESPLEGGTLGDVRSQTLQRVYSHPRSITNILGATVEAIFLGPLDGGLGDALASEQEFAKSDHIKAINKQILNGAIDLVKTAGDSGTAALASPGNWRIGDEFWTNTNKTEGVRITSLNKSSGVISFTQPDGGAATSLVDGEAVTVKSRSGMTSLDDIVEADGRTIAGTDNQDVDVYNVTTRTEDGYAASHVFDNSGTGRALSIDLIDDAITAVRNAGGSPDLILMDFDQLQNLEALLRSQQRYMGDGNFTVKMGTEETLPGYQTGFQISTYKGIAVLGDVDVPHSVNASNTELGSNVYVLDTEFLEIGVGYPTRYFESRDYLQNNTLGIKGMFWTFAELRCRDFTKQSKIVDLNT